MTDIVDANLNIVTFPHTLANGYVYPSNTVFLTDDALANVGFYRVHNRYPAGCYLTGNSTITWANSSYVVRDFEGLATPPNNPPVSTTINRRQFWQQCALAGFCSNNEALTYLTTGVIPSAIQTQLNTLSNSAIFEVQMVLTQPYYDLDNSLTTTLGALFNMSNTQLQTFWTAAGQL